MANKILIVGMPRGGSTYMYNLLSKYNGLSFDSAHICNEPFGTIRLEYRKMEIDDFNYLHSLYEQRLNSIKNIIDNDSHCVIKDHIQNYRSYEDDLGTKFPFDSLYKDFYKIKLIRNDFKALVYSLAIAKTTRAFYVFNEEDNVTQVTIDKEMLQYSIDHQWDILNLLYTDINKYDEVVVYDDLSGDPTVDQQLIQYTKDDIRDIKIELLKANKHQQSIANYDEVEHWFTEYTQKLSSDIIQLNSNGIINEKL